MYILFFDKENADYLFKLEIMTFTYIIRKAEKSPPPSKEPAKLDLKKKSTTGANKASVAKQEEPEQGEMFKMKKKSSATPRKILPKEEEQPAFAGMKLKKAQTVKRQWDDGGLETVDLKHHEFEKIPQDEQVTISPK